jgi:formylmethanofuran dehydrogenase subunit C
MLQLIYCGDTTIPLEAECISPDVLCGKSITEIAKLMIFHGNRQVPLGEFFKIEGDAHDGEIMVQGDCSRVKWMGAEMTFGRLTIEGNAGMHLGSEMRGGVIDVHGHAGDWVGAEMRGGRIHVHGNAGHLVGAAYRGSRKGMRGGAILIDGGAGNEIGASMRRGLIALGGPCGDFPGVSMIAGNIFLFNEVGQRPAAEMKRGTLAIFGPCPTLLPTFRFACDYRPVFVDLFLQRLRAWQFAPARREFPGRFRRYCGDLVSLGKGEILHWLGD